MKITILFLAVLLSLGCTHTAKVKVEVNLKKVSQFKQTQAHAVVLSPISAYSQCVQNKSLGIPDPNKFKTVAGEISYSVNIHKNQLKVTEFLAKTPQRHPRAQGCEQRINELSNEMYTLYSEKTKEAFGLSAKIFGDFKAELKISKKGKIGGEIKHIGTKPTMSINIHEGHDSSIKVEKSNLPANIGLGILTGTALGLVGQ